MAADAITVLWHTDTLTIWDKVSACVCVEESSHKPWHTGRQPSTLQTAEHDELTKCNSNILQALLPLSSTPFHFTPLSFILHATATCLSSVFAQLEVLCAKNLFALLCVNFQASQCLQISINMIKFFILKNLKKYFWYEVLFNFQFARITIQNWNRKLIMAYIPYSSHSSHGFVSYSVICLDFVVECKWINPLDAHVCHTRDSTSMFCAHFPHGMFHFAIFSFSLCLCVLSVCACVCMWLAHLFIFISQLSWYFIIYAHFLLNIYVNAEFKPLVVYPFSMSPPCSRTTSHHIVTISLYGVFMLLSVQILQLLFSRRL